MATEDTTMITEMNEDGTETSFEITAESGGDALAEDIVEALFDDPSAADEVVYGDLDGDGKIDTGAADTDGDGKLDTVVGDTDGDGQLDAIAVDIDGDGKLDAIGMDTDGDGIIDAVGTDADGDGNIDTIVQDTDGDGEADVIMTDTDGDGVPDEIEMIGEDAADESGEFAEDGGIFSMGDDTAEGSGDVYAAGYSGGVYDASTADAGIDISTEDAPVFADQTAADGAREAQAAADEFVAQGDYAAAADARAEAEALSAEAGDSSMLGAYDAQDLQFAGESQEEAAAFRAQQEEHLAEGDIEAAREDAVNAGYAAADADSLAGGADHTGQSDNDVYNLDNAEWNAEIAEQNANDAAQYAAEGDFDTAGIYAASADGHAEAAADFADQADPGSTMYDHDPSSAVETGGMYDGGGYDASMDVVDTGFDAPMETDVSTFDTLGDDTL